MVCSITIYAVLSFLSAFISRVTIVHMATSNALQFWQKPQYRHLAKTTLKHGCQNADSSSHSTHLKQGFDLIFKCMPRSVQRDIWENAKTIMITITKVCLLAIFLWKTLWTDLGKLILFQYVRCDGERYVRIESRFAWKIEAKMALGSFSRASLLSHPWFWTQGLRFVAVLYAVSLK